MYSVYGIYNPVHKKIYIGQTEDLGKRLLEHNDRNNPRHTYTNQFSGNWVLIYREDVNTRSDALKREKQLKSYRGREQVKKYIPR